MRTTLEAMETVKVLYVTTNDSPDAATVRGLIGMGYQRRE